jgi:hypothetical protein
VGLACHICVDSSEQGIDVWEQFLSDCVGGQLVDYRVDQFAERGAVGVKICLGLGDLLSFLVALPKV